jgi:prephenate dehydrogenase
LSGTASDPAFSNEARTAPPFQRIGIVGLGLIGGSIALAVREIWPSVVVVGVDRPAVADEAARRGAVHIGAGDLSPLAGADLIVLAAPVRQNVEILQQLAARVPDDAIVTDTGSTKRDIVHAAEALPPRLTFVGGHPLGGAAASGFGHARADLFARRHWLFTPASPANSDAEQKLFDFARALGARPKMLDAHAHDRLLAFVSHLPQLTASALMQVVGEEVGAENLAVAGRGLVDTTRLASSSSQLWQEIVASNADEIAPALDALIAVLQALRADLGSSDVLTGVFDAASRWRETLVSRSPV